MTWALAVALAWVVVLLPAGYLIGVAIRRAERRTVLQARRRVWRRAGTARLAAPAHEHRRAPAPSRGLPARGDAAAPGEEPLRRRGA